MNPYEAPKGEIKAPKPPRPPRDYTAEAIVVLIGFVVTLVTESPGSFLFVVAAGFIGLAIWRWIDKPRW